MSAHSLDATSVNLIGSGATAATVAGTSLMGVINEYAVVLGLGISIVSLIAGFCFKVSASRKEEIRREEELAYRAEEARQSRLQIDALAAMVESVITRDGIERRQDPR